MTDSVVWHSPSTLNEWKQLVADSIAQGCPLYVDSGNHPMPFIGQSSGSTSSDRQILVDGSLEIVGKGKELTTISPTQDGDTVRVDFNMFQLAPGSNLKLRDLSIQAPELTPMRSSNGGPPEFRTTIINCVDYGTHDTLVELRRVRVLGDDSHWFDVGFTSGGGSGLARQRFVVDDCEFGYSSLTISMFGPDGNNREVLLTNSSIGPSGGPGNGFEGFSGHTLYVHPGIVVRADNCHFLKGQRYILHYFSTGGRTPTKIPSVFTACVFEYSPDFLTCDDGGSDGNILSFVSSRFNTGSHHAFGSVEYTSCTFTCGVVYGGPLPGGSPRPVRLYGCKFIPTVPGSAGIGSGQNVKAYDCEFVNAYLEQQNAGGAGSWEFHESAFSRTQMFMSNGVAGSSVSLFGCSIDTSANTFGKNFFQVSAAGAVARVECTTLNTGVPASLADGATGSIALTGWGNKLNPSTTKVIGSSGITADVSGFGTISNDATTPVRSTDLAPKSYLDAKIAEVLALPSVRVSANRITDVSNADAGNILEIDYAGDAYVKIPPGLTVPVERSVRIRQIGTGTVTVLSDTCVVESLSGYNGLSGRWAEVLLTRKSQNDWLLTGNLIAGKPAPVFDPFSVAWGSAVWASDPMWTNPGDGNLVSAIRNGGASSGTLTATGAARPTFRSSVPSLNNRSAIDFNGHGNVLRQNVSTVSPVTSLVWIGQWKGSGGGNLDRVIDLNSPSLSSISLAFGSYWDQYSGVSNYGPGATTSGSSVRALFASGAGASKMWVAGAGPWSATLANVSGSASFILGGDAALSAGNFANVYTAFAGLYSGDVTTDSNWNLFVSWVLSYYGLVLA